MTKLGDMLEKRAREREAVPSETARICGLPRVSYEGTGGVRAWGRPGGTLKLRPVQAAALLAIQDSRGGFLPIGVGHGKSWVACLAATALDRDLAIIVAPAGTLKQLRDTHAELSRHFDVRAAAFVSYGAISGKTGGALLANLMRHVSAKRTVLVLDEAHKIRNATAARTMRVIRFSVAHPDVAVVAMSGTLTSKSIADMSHLAEMALRDKSPIPRNARELDIWSRCMDVDGRAAAHDWRWMEQLAQWSGHSLDGERGEQRQQVLRLAFRDRLDSCPGVVSTRDASVSCALYLGMHEESPDDLELRELISAAQEGIHPSGEIIIDDLERHRVLTQLAAGFWYRWVWPDGQPDEAWLESRRAWGRFVRSEIERNAREGYDSPGLVYDQVALEFEHGSRRAIHLAWYAWSIQKHKPEPPVEPVWVSDWLVRFASGWLAEHPDAIVWYQSEAVATQLEAAGITVYRAGDDPPREAHSCAMSIRAHGTGLNLQSWSRALVLEPPSSGSTWEQLLGRLHRQGQHADEVIWEVMAHAPPLRTAMRAADKSARYIAQTTGQRQKLLIAAPYTLSPPTLGAGFLGESP
jgi:hypothetical protein